MATMIAHDKRGFDFARWGLPALLILMLVCNIAFWTQARHARTTWGNVPPVPSERGAIIAMLGDAQMGYRVYGLMLQNLGDIGGRITNLAQYDYTALKDWFFLEDTLDPKSNYIPALAAYYYGATTKHDDLTPVIDYLEVIGQRPEPQKWRWLAQAVFLSRYTQNDLVRSFDLATKLANLSTPDMPAWTRQMPAFILVARGEKEAAYDILMGMLQNDAEKMDPAEIRLIRDWICDKILTPAQAASHPVCTSIPGG